MEQLKIFPDPYKYIMDTSSILSQKEKDFFPRKKHPQTWNKIDKLVREGIIVTCSEVVDEIKNDEIKKWLRDNNCTVLTIDDEIQEKVSQIIAEHPNLISFSRRKCSSSGDPFLIATAIKFKLIVITEEKEDSVNKIPSVCDKYGIESISIRDLPQKEGWPVQ